MIKERKSTNEVLENQNVDKRLPAMDAKPWRVEEEMPVGLVYRTVDVKFGFALLQLPPSVRTVSSGRLFSPWIGGSV